MEATVKRKPCRDHLDFKVLFALIELHDLLV